MLIMGSTGSYNIQFDYDLILIKIDLDGSIIWQNIYAEPGNQFPKHLLESKDHMYVVTAHSAVDLSQPDGVYFLKTNAAGDKQWSTVNLVAGMRSANHSIQMTDEGYATIGCRDINGIDEIYLLKTSSTGQSVWMKTYTIGNNYSNDAFGLIQMPDNSLITVGNTTDIANTHIDAFVMSTSVNGDSLWYKTAHTKADTAMFATQIFKDGNTNLVVGSQFHQFNDPTIFLFKINSDGNFTP
jgi:hypothetical protein